MSQSGAHCCSETEELLVPLTANHTDWLFYTKTVHTQLGRPKRQSSVHSDPFLVHMAFLCATTYFRGGIHQVLIFTLTCQNQWSDRTRTLRSSQPWAAEESTVTAHDGIKVILALARANDFTKASEQILIPVMLLVQAYPSLPMSGKTSLPQMFNQPLGTLQGSASHHHLQLAQDMELVNPS